MAGVTAPHPKSCTKRLFRKYQVLLKYRADLSILFSLHCSILSQADDAPSS